MEIGNEIKQTLDLPDVSQIGLVVKNLDKTIDYYEKVLGLGPFVRPEITFIEKFYDDTAADFEMEMAFCSLGPLEMELIQPVTPPTVYHDFLEKRGEGLHHLALEVSNIQNAIETLKEKGVTLVDEKPRIGVENSQIAFLHPKGTKVLLEIVEPRE